MVLMKGVLVRERRRSLWGRVDAKEVEVDSCCWRMLVSGKWRERGGMAQDTLRGIDRLVGRCRKVIIWQWR